MAPKNKQREPSQQQLRFNSAASSKGPGDIEMEEKETMPENRGILWGKTKEECFKLGIDLFAQDVDMNHLFGDLHGAALLDQIHRIYGDGVYDVPWFVGGVCPANAEQGGVAKASQWQRTDKHRDRKGLDWAENENKLI